MLVANLKLNTCLGAAACTCCVQSPYLLPWMNHLWTGLWLSLVYTTGLQLSLQYTVTPNLGVPGAELVWRESLTWAVLYGIFPSVLLGKSDTVCC